MRIVKLSHGALKVPPGTGLDAGSGATIVIPSGGAARRRSRGIAGVLAEEPSIWTTGIPRFARNDNGNSRPPQ